MKCNLSEYLETWGWGGGRHEPRRTAGAESIMPRLTDNRPEIAYYYSNTIWDWVNRGEKQGILWRGGAKKEIKGEDLNNFIFWAKMSKFHFIHPPRINVIHCETDEQSFGGIRKKVTWDLLKIWRNEVHCVLPPKVWNHDEPRWHRDAFKLCTIIAVNAFSWRVAKVHGTHDYLYTVSLNKAKVQI